MLVIIQNVYTHCRFKNGKLSPIKVRRIILLFTVNLISKSLLSDDIKNETINAKHVYL